MVVTAKMMEMSTVKGALELAGKSLCVMSKIVISICVIDSVGSLSLIILFVCLYLHEPINNYMFIVRGNDGIYIISGDCRKKENIRLSF